MVDTEGDHNPLDLLRELEQRGLAAAAALPELDGAQRRWRGIGFRLGDQRLVVEMGDIREVLHPPRIARVPGTKPWLTGLASLRGALLPVADLGAFLCGRVPALTRESRVLVVHESEVLVGLQVEEVFGLQQFPTEGFGECPATLPSWLQPYTVGCFHKQDENWQVFDVKALVRATEFLQAAA